MEFETGGFSINRPAMRKEQATKPPSLSVVQTDRCSESRKIPRGKTFTSFAVAAFLYRRTEASKDGKSTLLIAKQYLVCIYTIKVPSLLLEAWLSITCQRVKLEANRNEHTYQHNTIGRALTE